MPPLLAAIPAIITAGSGIAGVVEGAQAGGRQQKALTQQEQIAKQEMQDKQKIFQQLSDFFTPYLKSGSPFLQNIQSAAAGQNAQQANDAAGQFREEIGATGRGFGPSGSTAAGLSGIGSSAASTSASDYLTNLLNNEQIKFQAAKGLNEAGTMAGGGQNQPNVSASLPYQSTGSGLTGLSQVLKNLLGGGSTGIPQIAGSVPGTPAAGAIQPSTYSPPSVLTPPGTQGWAL